MKLKIDQVFKKSKLNFGQLWILTPALSVKNSIISQCTHMLHAQKQSHLAFWVSVTKQGKKRSQYSEFNC